MVKSGILGRKKAIAGGATASGSSGKRRQFKDYHAEWAELLKNNFLPRLRRAMHESSLAHLSNQVDVLRHHLSSYYDALDLSATTSSGDGDHSAAVTSLLHPGDWRTPLETPFLWLGDLHPYLFTNLLRSFLDTDKNSSDSDGDGFGGGEGNSASSFQIRLRTRFALLNDSNELFNRPWHIVTAWKNPSPSLMARVEQIECGVRLMVPALTARARAAQTAFVAAVAGEWRRGTAAALQAEVIGKAAAAQAEEMVGVLVDANRLRRSVLSEIVGATSVYQGALFLEGLSQFLVGFRDSDLVSEFLSCKTTLRTINLSNPI